MTSAAMTSVISLPGLRAGRSRSAWRCGLTLDLFGPEVAPASPSAPPESSAERLTSGISGLNSAASSRSAALQSSLESRLRARLAGAGSPLFVLTWKAWDMASGPPICALRASAPRTSGSGSGGWPTPRVFDIHNESLTTALARQARQKAAMAAGGPRWSGCMGLPAYAQMASWPTASARDWKGATHDRWGSNARPLNEVARLASWPTPTSALANKGVRSHEGAIIEAMRRSGADLAAMVSLTHGEQSNGSPAGTEKPGQLNPAFSLWLMGYPAEWESCAPQATPSSRKSRRSSSAQ